MNNLVAAVIVEVRIGLSSQLRGQKARMVTILTVNIDVDVDVDVDVEVMIYPSSLISARVIRNRQ